MATETKTTKAAWKKAKRHDITLPSGTEVSIEIPNLPLLIKTGHFPNELIDAALGAVKRDTITPELINQQSDFYHELVALTVKVPEISVEDVLELPYEDVELIVELATRNRDVDALGHHIAGLHKVSDWRKFRGLDYGDEDLDDL
jgi:hypothetical protein